MNSPERRITVRDADLRPFYERLGSAVERVDEERYWGRLGADSS